MAISASAGLNRAGLIGMNEGPYTDKPAPVERQSVVSACAACAGDQQAHSPPVERSVAAGGYLQRRT